MQIISTDNFPKDNNGFYAHYFHVKMRKTDLQYLDVKGHVAKRETEWLNNIDSWHAELSKVGLKYTKWWWFLPWTRLISFDPPILKRLLFAYAIIELLEKNNIQKLYLIKCPNEVLEHIKEFRPNINITVLNMSLSKRFRNKFFLQIKSLVFSQQMILLKQIISLLIRVNKKNNSNFHSNKIKIIIYSHLLDKDEIINKGDHYYGKMFDNVPEKEKLWLYFSELNNNSEKYINKYLNDKKISYLIIQNLLNNKQVLKIWVQCAKIVFSLNKLRNNIPALKLNQEVSKKFPQQYFNSLIINFLPVNELVIYFAFEEIFNNNQQINTVIYPYEEKGLERAILKACDNSSNKVRTIGYAHAVHSKGHLYLKRRSSNSINAPKPNVIAATGVNSKKWLVDWAKISPSQIQVIGSNRYSPPFLLKNKNEYNSSSLKILLVIGIWYELVMFANYVEELPGLFDDCELWIRKYPFAWLNHQNQALDQINQNIQNLKTNDAPLSEQFEWSDIVLFSSTSAGIEAMLSGRYSIYVDLHDLMKVNPIENKGDISKVTCCSNPIELKETLNIVKNFSGEEFINAINGQVDFARKIYEPIDKNYIIKDLY